MIVLAVTFITILMGPRPIARAALCHVGLIADAALSGTAHGAARELAPLAQRKSRPFGGRL